MKYLTKEAVHKRALEVEKIPFENIDKTNRLKTGKGGVGTMIEENWFNLIPNNLAKADFPEAGVELKVTPIKKNKNGTYSAKERLVLNIINYMTEYQLTFKESSFWKKNKLIELLFYEHNNDVKKTDWYIEKAVLFSYPEEDLKIIQDDWHKIVKYIKAGKAHELSESMTDILGACTKGASAESLREQPFSTIKAKQRAFSLKASYMTYLLRSFILGSEMNESIIKSMEDLKDVTFEKYVSNKVSEYVGFSQSELIQKFNIPSGSKDINNIIISRIFGMTGKIQNSIEFQKMNIIPKTLTINSKNKIRESMSFPTFTFKTIILEDWENSELREYFETNRFMFAIFKENTVGEIMFEGIKFWNMPINDLDKHLYSVWKNTVETLKQGVVFTDRLRNGEIFYNPLEIKKQNSENKVYNNLPKSTNNPVGHVRPHTAVSAYAPMDKDADELPDGRWMTKQCFWLNNSYILRQVEEFNR